MSAPVLSRLFSAQGKSGDTPAHPPDPREVPPSTQRASSSSCSDLAYKARSLRPVLRAIPFPEVTELFCRLPSATLLYRLEAANLGDLMRLWVRAGAKMKQSFGVSRTDTSEAAPSKHERLLQSIIPLSRRADSRD